MKGTIGGVSNVSLPPHPGARRPHLLPVCLHRDPSCGLRRDVPTRGPAAPSGTEPPVLDSHQQSRGYRRTSDAPSTTQEVKGGE
jgi:hypothetical protein